MRIVSCVLAGGKSKRFGGDKRFAKLNGKRLIDYALTVALEVSDEVYISARYKESFEIGYKIINDDTPFLGPACGITNVIDKIDSDIYVFLAADMPFIKKEHILRLIEAASEPAAVCYEYEGKIKTLPLVIYDPYKEIPKKDCADRKILDLFSDIGIRTINSREDTIFFNINSYNDLKEAEKILLYLTKR